MVTFTDPLQKTRSVCVYMNVNIYTCIAQAIFIIQGGTVFKRDI